MAWNVHHEEEEHFIVHGNAGEKGAFRIHKANLSPRAVEAMRKMAKGGKVEPGPAAKRTKQAFPDGGEVQPDAPAVPGEQDGMAPSRLPTTPQDHVAADPEAGGEIPDPPPTAWGAETPRVAPPPLPAPPPAAGASTQQRPVPAAPFEAPASGVQSPGDIMRAAGETGQALQNKATVEKTAADAIAKQEQRRAQADRDYASTLESHYALNRQALTAMIDDINKTKINPEQFWENEKGQPDTWKKVRAGIGLLISGIGAGLTGQPNMAAQFIQRSIERNIDAQKANLAKKQNVYSYYRQLLGDDVAATNMTHSVLMNSMAAEIESASRRAGGQVAQANGAVLAKQVHQQALEYANQAAAQAPQVQLAKVKLAQEVRNEGLLRSIYGSGGVAPDQRTIAEAGARGLVKPVVTDRAGTLGIARSDADAAKLNDELPPLHTAQDILERMQQLRNKEGPYRLIAPTDAADEYNKLRSELAVNVEKGLAGRVSDQTIHNQIASIGSDANEFYHSADPLSAVRQTIDAQHRAIVNQRTWSRESPNVRGLETAPSRGGASPTIRPGPPVAGAIHVTNGAQSGWLLPGKPLPTGWRQQ